MKKKTSIISFLTIVIMLVINILSINNVSATGLEVTFSTNPTVVAPGTYSYLAVNLKSVGGTVSDIDISAETLDENAIIPEGNWVINIDTLDSGDSYAVLYEFRVASTAQPELYQIVFDITSSAGDTRQTAIIKVEDNRTLDIASVTPSSISIGQATTLVFNLTNTGDVAIKNVLFTWHDSNDLILPVGSDNRITIPLIDDNNHTDVPISVMASSGISPGIYPLTITMIYNEQSGNEQTITSTVGLQISGTTTFDVVLQTSTGTSTTFAIVNTGANTASSVVVSIPQQPGYTTSGASSASVGNLEAGDYTLASFQLTSTTSNSSQPFPSFNRTGMGGGIPPDWNSSGGRDRFMNRSFSGLTGNRLLMQIAYTDVFGVRQTVQKQVNLSSGSSSGFLSRTGTQGSSGNFPGGFSGQSRSSSGSSNSIAYIVIGVVGIIVIVALIQLGRKKKLPHVLKFFKGRRKE
jgi:hypothetical protein